MSGRSGGLAGVRALWATVALSVALSVPHMLGGSPRALAQDRSATQGRAPKVLLIDAGGAADADLAARIAGQTRDLPLLLEPTSSSEPDFDQARAQALAGQRGAAAVVWTAPAQGGAIEVHVLDALRGRERTRIAQLQPQAQPDDDPLARSALLETTALIVRSELANLLEQENLATRAAHADAARATGAAGTATAASGQEGKAGTGPSANDGEPGVTGSDGAGTDDDDQAGGRKRLLDGWSARAGFRVARVDRDNYAYGPLLGLGYDVGYFAFGLQATTAWPIELEFDELTVKLRRHSVALSAQHRLYARGDLRLLASVDGGAVLYARGTTEILAGTLHSTLASTTLSAAFGAGLELQWLPIPFIGLAFSAGLDLLTAPPKFALVRVEQQQILHRIAVYEPWAALSILVRP